MSAKPIYVELPIRTDMETLWHHTQTPELHREWDLRFSDIDYLPRRDGESRQRFLYRTRIGFGLSIAGTGETRAYPAGSGGERLSTLRFGSDQRISLIRQGGGYWRYKPEADRVVFITRYDYRTRFGLAGRLFDRLLFRPLFGYATAWSFDALRIWLERRVPPSALIRQSLVHYASILLLALLWFYQGLVPKLLFPMAGEAELLARTGLFPGMERPMTALLGLAEIALAVLIALRHRSRLAIALQSALLAMLTGAALFAQPGLSGQPFGPIPIALAMLGLGLAAAWTADGLPDAGRCLRKPRAASPPLPSTHSTGGDHDGIHL